MKEGFVGNGVQDLMTDGQRREERDSLLVLARLSHGGGDAETVRVRNVSSGGLMAQASAEYRPGMRVEVEVDGLGRLDGCVAWAEAGRIGIAFDHPVEKALARKPAGQTTQDLFRPLKGDFRRPPLKGR